MLKDITFSVKARPSRPSGKSTVISFLSSLTTTLEMDQKVNIPCGSIAKIGQIDTLTETQSLTFKKRIKKINANLPELLRSMPPRVKLTSLDF